jgi:hypothetical protein
MRGYKQESVRRKGSYMIGREITDVTGIVEILVNVAIGVTVVAIVVVGIVVVTAIVVLVAVVSVGSTVHPVNIVVIVHI